MSSNIEKNNRIQHLKKQISDIDRERGEIEDKIYDLTNKKEELEIELNIAKSTYTMAELGLDFGIENIYVPEKFRIDMGSSYSVISYSLEYDNNIFNLYDRPDGSTPGSFQINNNNRYERLLINIYYKFPKEIYGYDSLLSELNSIEVSIERAKVLLGDVWTHELSFGIAIFYYLIKYAYQDRGASFNKLNKTYNTLEKIFDKYYSVFDS